MKRCAWLAVVICLCFLGLAARSVTRAADAPRSDAVFVDRKGKISAWFVEDFAEDYYSPAELAEMAGREAAEYNAGRLGKKPAVKVEKVELLPGDSGKIRVKYRFDGWESYADFNGESFFYGKAGELAGKGLEADVVLKSVADDSFLGGLPAGEAGGYVIVTDVKADIYCPREVTHVSGGLTVNEDGSIDTSGASGTAYILMK